MVLESEIIERVVMVVVYKYRLKPSAGRLYSAESANECTSSQPRDGASKTRCQECCKSGVLGSYPASAQADVSFVP